MYVSVIMSVVCAVYVHQMQLVYDCFNFFLKLWGEAE